jgi:hypothetical protein
VRRLFRIGHRHAADRVDVRYNESEPTLLRAEACVAPCSPNLDDAADPRNACPGHTIAMQRNRCGAVMSESGQKRPESSVRRESALPSTAALIDAPRFRALALFGRRSIWLDRRCRRPKTRTGGDVIVPALTCIRCATILRMELSSHQRDCKLSSCEDDL